MNINQLTKSKYLKAADIEDDCVFTIAGVQMEEIGQNEKKDNKPVLYFEEEERGLVLNKTNINSIANLYGEETDEWVGKKIGLFIAPTTFEGRTVESIRVKARMPKAQTATALGNRQPTQPQPTGFRKPQPQQLEDDDSIPF